MRAPQHRRARRLAATGVAGGLAASLLAAGVATAQTVEPLPQAAIDWSEERQHVDGFGGSFAFHKAGAVQRLGEPLSGQILDLVFDDEAGIDFDIARVMVGDGGINQWGDRLYDGPTDTIQPADGPYVWDMPDWEERKDEFDAYQVWLMQEAQARGVETIMASVWSPPAWMKQNNSVLRAGFGGPPNKLRVDMYQEFADYLAEYVLGYAEHFGINITHISPTNEPDLSTSYSSSEWTSAELNTFVRDYLGPTFEARGVDAEIVVGETVGFSEDRVRPLLLDPVTEPYVDVVAAHAYTGLINGSTAPRPDAFALSNELGKSVWQTEYMNQGAPRDNWFSNNTITDGLRYATLIANMFDTSRLNAYFWWWPVANNGADGSDLIRLVNEGNPQSGNPTETGEYRIFKRFYAIGQYSRFVDDGDVMIGADKNPVAGVTVSAFKDGETEDYAIVVVNNNAADVEIEFDLEGGFPLKADSAVAPFRTSASENMRRLDDIAVAGGSFTATLRGASVTTFVPSGDELPELADRKDVFSTYPAAESDGRSAGLETVVTDRGEVVAGVHDGSFLRYDNVNFADGSAAGAADQRGELAIHAHVRPRAGGEIVVRLGDPETGPVVGAMRVPAGDGEEWVRVSSDIDTSAAGARGFHDLYLVFAGGDSPLLDIHYTEFSDVVGEVPALTGEAVELADVAGGDAFAGAVARFFGGSGTGAESYSAVIDWGDGTPPTAGTVVVDDGFTVGYRVEGEHTYAQAGEYDVVTTITDAAGGTVSATSTLTVTAGQGPAVTVTADTRCVAGRVVEVARVTNESDAPLEVDVSSSFGSRTVTVGADRTTAVSFSTRSASVDAGSVDVTADGAASAGSYGARSCA